MVVPDVLCLTVTSHTKLAIEFTLNLQSFDMFECSFQMPCKNFKRKRDCRNMFSFTKMSELNNLHCIFRCFC